MQLETRTTDARGRVCLPKSFANATVVLEIIGDTEIRIRKAQVVPVDELPFREELPPVLSNRDWDRFMTLLSRPPKANAALRRAFANHRARHG
jgi:hypothetical protein